MSEMLQAEVFAILDQQLQPGPILLGFSGGLDSCVLLTLLARYVADRQGFSLQALHVHHGLNPYADHWLQHCAQMCAELSVPFIAERARIEKRARQSLEDLARQARYELFRKHLPAGGYLLTAHHQDDQLETLLLALKRGSGPRGLAAMPANMAFAAGTLVRPLLHFSREQLNEWAISQHLNWIEDDSNQDQRFDRNFLRQVVIPLLRKRWPAISHTAGRTASLCAEQESLLDEIAAADLQNCQHNDGSLQIAHLIPLSLARRHQVFRYWLRQITGTVPSLSQLHKIWPEVALAKEDAMPELVWQMGAIRRYQGRLYQVSKQQPFDYQSVRVAISPDTPVKLPGGTLMLHSESLIPGRLRLPMANEDIRVVFYVPGSVKVHPAGRNHAREFKKLWQEYEIAPWRRQSIPIIYYGDTVAAVAGLFICQGFQCPDDESGLCIEWYVD